MEEINYADYKKSRLFYILESAFEYFVTIFATGAALTALMSEMEISASLQGIINSIASLVCVFQALSVFAVKKTYPCKYWVSILFLVNECLFALMFFVPNLSVSYSLRVGIFITIYVLAQAIAKFTTPSRLGWLTSIVEDSHRGVFAANNEIVSLISGVFVSQAAGMLLDYYKAKGDMQTVFIIFGITIFALSATHVILLFQIKEPEPMVSNSKKSFKEVINTVFKTKELRRVIAINILFFIGDVPLYFSTFYMVNVMGLSYTYLAVTGMLYSFFRAFVSRGLGRLADKRSWPYMLKICSAVMAIGYFVYAFASIKVVVFLYPVFILCQAFYFGGSNSGRMNICFDYIEKDDRRYILGIKDTIGGIAAFLFTLVASFFVERVNNAGNMIFGVEIFPQRIIFVSAAIIHLVLTFFVLPKFEKRNANS